MIQQFSADDYMHAFETIRPDLEKGDGKGWRMLEAHYLAPNHQVTVDDIAALVGETDRRRSNLLYGQYVGKTLCAALNPRPVLKYKIAALADLSARDASDRLVFTMREPAVEALTRLGWFRGTADLHDGSAIAMDEGGFGSPETNKMVEKAAVKVVKDHYRGDGWTVESVEAIKGIGYDLICTKRCEVTHVEVKGTSGAHESFLMTRAEFKASRSDDRYVLALVTNALSDKATLQLFERSKLWEGFEFAPITFQVCRR